MLQLLSSAPQLSYESFFFAEGVFLCAVTLVCALLQQWAGRFVVSLPLVLFVLVCPAPLLVCFAYPALGIPAVFFGAVLGGSAQMCMFLQCFALYRRLDVRYGFGYALLSFAAAPLVRLPLDVAPLSVSALLASTLPILCFVMCNRANKVIERDADAAIVAPPASAESVRMFAPYIVALVLFGVALGCLNLPLVASVLDFFSFLTVTVLKVVAPLALLAFVAKNQSTIAIGHLCQVALVIVVFALGFIPQTGSLETSSFSAVASDLAHYVMVVLLYSTLLAVPQKMGLHPFAVFTLGYGPYAFAVALGMTSAALFGPSAAGLALPVVYALCLLGALVVVALNIRYDSSARLFSARNELTGLNNVSQSIGQACEEIASRYGLTGREQEIMCYICEGHSKSYIASELFISQNTVRTHAKTLYKKLDVHSRDDLLDMVMGRM